MPFTLRQQKGNKAEDIACRYLQKKGMRLVRKNFSCKYGEIDLIMQDQDTLVFVEVRYRSNDYYGTAIESINHLKQQRIRKTAEWYLQYHDEEQEYCWRYDCIGIMQGLFPNKFKIEWIVSAIEETE